MKCMRRLLTTALFGVMALSPALPAQAQFSRSSKEPQIRSVSGEVMNSDDAPVKDAVVYLKNLKSLAIKSYITQPDGKYSFLELSPNVDYQVWAESNGQKSANKTVSSFDSRPQFHYDLHLQESK